MFDSVIGMLDIPSITKSGIGPCCICHNPINYYDIDKGVRICCLWCYDEYNLRRWKLEETKED